MVLRPEAQRGRLISLALALSVASLVMPQMAESSPEAQQLTDTFEEPNIHSSPLLAVTNSPAEDGVQVQLPSSGELVTLRNGTPVEILCRESNPTDQADTAHIIVMNGFYLGTDFRQVPTDKLSVFSTNQTDTTLGTPEELISSLRPCSDL